MQDTPNFITNLLSGRGRISAKRFLGLIMIAVSQLCIIYLTIMFGNTATVQNLIETNMIVGACLLGVTSVTGIWKRTGYNGVPYLNSSYGGDNQYYDQSYYNRYNNQSYDNQSYDNQSYVNQQYDNQQYDKEEPDPDIMNKKPKEPIS